MAKKIKRAKRECCGIYAGQDCAPMHESTNGCICHPDNKKVKRTPKPKKIKTYVITMMVKFPKQGIIVAKPTGFKQKILSGEKKHTIRQNYKFWKKRIDEINAGNAILSVRQWSGLPYRSEQRIIKSFSKGQVGYERIIMFDNATELAINTESEKGYVYLSDSGIRRVAKNDGVPIDLFRKFFKNGVLDGIIIHFSKLRYSK